LEPEDNDRKINDRKMNNSFPIANFLRHVSVINVSVLSDLWRSAMPIEAGAGPTAFGDTSPGDAYLAECRATLESAFRKIEHCLAQLTDADLWWRQHESHNSIQNVILHLCGNLRQWILHGVGGETDPRDRPGEFADREKRPKAELLATLREMVAKCDRVLVTCPAERLLERRRIQGFDTTVLTALFDTVSHFVGHQHQIVYITRLRLGDAYRFQWAPATPEQGAPARP
jgi:hypothetical protein